MMDYVRRPVCLAFNLRREIIIPKNPLRLFCGYHMAGPPHKDLIETGMNIERLFLRIIIERISKPKGQTRKSINLRTQDD